MGGTGGGCGVNKSFGVVGMDLFCVLLFSDTINGGVDGAMQGDTHVWGHK